MVFSCGLWCAAARHPYNGAVAPGACGSVGRGEGRFYFGTCLTLSHITVAAVRVGAVQASCPCKRDTFRPFFLKASIRVWVLVVVRHQLISLPPSSLGPGCTLSLPTQTCWPDWDEQKSLRQRSECKGKDCVPSGKKDSVPWGHPCSAPAAFCCRFSQEGRDPCLPSTGLPMAQLSQIHLSPVTVIKSDLQWGKNSIFRIAGY